MGALIISQHKGMIRQYHGINCKCAVRSILVAFCRPGVPVAPPPAPLHVDCVPHYINDLEEDVETPPNRPNDDHRAVDEVIVNDDIDGDDEDDEDDVPQDASPAPEMTQAGPTPDLTGNNLVKSQPMAVPDITENAGRFGWLGFAQGL